MRFFAAMMHQLGLGAKSLQRIVSPEPTSQCKISPQLVPVYQSHFRKGFRMTAFSSAYNNQLAGILLLAESAKAAFNIIICTDET